MDTDSKLPKVVTLDDSIDLTKLSSRQFNSLLKSIQGIGDPLTVEFALKTPAGCEERLLALFEVLSQKRIEHLYIYNCNFREVNNIPEILAYLGKMRYLKTLDIGGTQLFTYFMEGEKAFGVDRWNAFLKALSRLNALEAFCLHECSILDYLEQREVKALFDMLEEKATLRIVSFAGLHNTDTVNFIIKLLVEHPVIYQVDCVSPSMLPIYGWDYNYEEAQLAPKEYEGDKHIKINAEREARQLPDIEFKSYRETDIRIPLDRAPIWIMINLEWIEKNLLEEKVEEASPSGTPSSQNSSPISSTSSTSSVVSEGRQEALPSLAELNITKTNDKKVDVK